MLSRPWRRVRWHCGVVAGVALVALAGCGSSQSQKGTSSGATSGGVAQAKAIVAKAEQPISQPPSAPKFDATGLKGKSIWFVSYSFGIPYAQQVWRGVQEAASALGMKATSFDGKFSASEESRGIGLAVAAKADAIIVHSLPASVVAPALARAHAAGIKLISAETQNPGPALPDVPKTIDAIAGHSYSIPTRTMAAQVVADSNGHANVLFFSANDIGPGSKQGTDTFVATMHQLCQGCHVKVVDAPVAQWSSLGQRVSSLLRSDPSINYVVPIFDGMSVYMVPGVRSAGAQNRVKIVSGDATSSVLENIERHNVVIGDVGQPNVWTGWAIVDQVARVLTGQKPLDDVGIKYRLFTQNNVGGLNLNGDPTAWYGTTDFRGAYKQIWGIG